MDVFGSPGLMGPQPVTGNAGAAAPAMAGPTAAQAPPPAAGTPAVTPGTLQLTTPGTLSLEPGMMLRGQVVGQEDDLVTLQFGRTQLTAFSGVDLEPGAFVDLHVQGQQQGKWSLLLVGSQQYVPMSEHDLSSSLLDLKLPVSEGTLQLARAMVEQGVPLEREGLQDLNRVLTQLPHEATPQDAQAATFLKAGNLPVTPQNVTVLANFILEHPFIGSQMMSLQQSFRRLVESTDGRLPRDLEELLAEAPGMIGELVVDPRMRNRQKMQSNMQRMAFQAGIENLGPHVGDDTDYLEWLRFLRAFMAEHEARCPELIGAGCLLDDLAENLAAQRLINGAAQAEQGAFYMQIPLQDGRQTAETKLIYHKDSEGRPQVDAHDTDLEIAVPTHHVGEVRYSVTIRDDRLAVDVTVASDEAARHFERYFPVLVDNLERIGYHVQGLACRPRAVELCGLQPVVSGTLERMERVSISA